MLHVHTYPFWDFDTGPVYFALLDCCLLFQIFNCAVLRSRPFAEPERQLVMGYRLNFIISHRLESVDAFDAILPIIIGSHTFTELSTFYMFYDQEGNSEASGFYPVTVYVFVRV